MVTLNVTDWLEDNEVAEVTAALLVWEVELVGTEESTVPS